MNGWLLAAIIAVVLVLVVAKRLKGEPVNVRDLFAGPAVLTGLGVLFITKADGVTGTDIAWVVPGAFLGLGLGAARGALVRLFEKDGTLWQRYTGRTFLVVIASLLVSAGYGVVAEHLGMHPYARPTQLTIGVSFLGESLLIYYRARKTGTPFAPQQESPLAFLDRRFR
ncbi:hypothetical protein [Streptomyces monomycini]|uniref:hypothetical protein n=1 Tax=Streptomyces monomycini TaxID=371720 RepID=UPI0004AA4590|nr:hypothetical protein [Streptomyces monomycini]